VSTTSLLISIYILIYMKLPKDGGKDNELAEFLNGLNFLGNLTINELVSTSDLTRVRLGSSPANVVL
jgi:hypothetical protein